LDRKFGVNGAPEIAKSTVGIAMVAADYDVALETADISLMADRYPQTGLEPIK